MATIREQVLDLLQKNPDGITGMEMAKLMNVHVGTVGPALHKLVIDGKAHVDGNRETSAHSVSRIYKFGPPPAKLENAERTIRIVATVTPAEHQRIYQAANASGLHPASYVRAAALEKAEATGA